MAISDAQKVDLLFKQAFGVTKTDTSTNKGPSNEAIASPAIVRGDKIWSQSDQIPGTAAATSGIVELKKVECTIDNTTVPVGGIYPTWKTSFTNWIPVEFGPTYSVKVYVNNAGQSADPSSGGTQIFDAGVGGVGEFYFNYSSGVLNFIGGTIPAALTSGKKIYVVGYRYIGSVGSAALPSNTNIGNINLNGNTISTIQTNSNLNISGNGTGGVVVAGTGNIYANNFIASQAVYTDSLLYANGVAWDLQEAAGSDGYIQFNTGDNFDATANLQFDSANSNLNVIGNINVGSGSNIKLYGNGSIVATNITANITGKVTGGITSIGANLNVLYNFDGNVASQDTFKYTPASNALSVGNSVTSNYFIGKFDSTSSSQPNITTLGNLTGLQIGSTSTTGIVTLDTDGNANVVNLNASASINGKDATFSGNLTVSGSTTFVNTTVTTIKDPLITLGGNATGGNAESYDGKDRGLILDNYDSVGATALNQALIWKTTTGQFELGSNVSVTDNVVTVNEYANVKAAKFLGNLSGTSISVTNITGTITTTSNAQPNITSVGTLTSANVSGLANVAQLKVGTVTYPNVVGTDGQYLRINATSNTVYYSSLDTTKIANGTSEIDVLQNGNINFTVGTHTNSVVFVDDGSVILGSGSGGNIEGVNYLNANVANVTTVAIGDSMVQAATATTTSTSTQTLLTISSSTITGIEFLVKGQCTASGASKYSVATVLAVSDGTGNVDYSVFGTAYLIGSTGTLSVTGTSGAVSLKVAPSTTNQITWTIQYRTI